MECTVATCVTSVLYGRVVGIPYGLTQRKTHGTNSGRVKGLP